MTLLADLSRYDPDEAAAQYDGAILNVEDPGVGTKAAIANAAGKPVMLYSWVYPRGGAQAVQHGVAVAQSLGVPVKGIWLDYEQDGVVPNDVRAARSTDTGGFRFGVYAYLAMMNAQGQDLTDAIGDWPLWMAYYPGGNDGSYQAWYSDDARARSAVLHQFTSTNGTRDLNIVLDDAWFNTWTGTGPPPPPKKRGHDMELLISPTRALSHTAGVLDAQFPDPTHRFNDIPTSASGFLAANPGAQVSHVGEETYDRVLTKITAPPSAPGSGPTHFTGTVDLHGV